MAAADFDFDNGWLSSTIWTEMMVAEMRAVEFGQPKWGHYALVEIAGGTGLNWGGVGVM